MRATVLFFACLCLTSAAELHQAAKTCNPDRLSSLLAQKPPLNEVDENGLTPLHNAIQAGQTPCVRLLLAQGADPQAKDPKGRNGFDAAMQRVPDLADRQAVESWRALVALLAQANQKKTPAPTPAQTAPVPWSLEYTANRGQSDVTKMLLQMGADPNVPAKSGTAPLADAALKGDLASVRLLLEYKAKVDSFSPAGTQAIHDAALGGNPEVIRELIKHGASTAARSRQEGQTPLHFAASMGRMTALEALIALGADPASKDSKGLTALDVAERAGLAEVVTYLRSASTSKRQPSSKQ